MRRASHYGAGGGLSPLRRVPLSLSGVSGVWFVRLMPCALAHPLFERGRRVPGRTRPRSWTRGACRRAAASRTCASPCGLAFCFALRATAASSRSTGPGQRRHSRSFSRCARPFARASRCWGACVASAGATHAAGAPGDRGHRAARPAEPGASGHQGRWCCLVPTPGRSPADSVETYTQERWDNG